MPEANAAPINKLEAAIQAKLRARIMQAAGAAASAYCAALKAATGTEYLSVPVGRSSTGQAITRNLSDVINDITKAAIDTGIAIQFDAEVQAFIKRVNDLSAP